MSTISPTKTECFDLEVIQAEIRAYIHEHPQGVKQADIAKDVLRIPAKIDKNWITHYILNTMLDDGQITRNDLKMFHLA